MSAGRKFVARRLRRAGRLLRRTARRLDPPATAPTAPQQPTPPARRTPEQVSVELARPAPPGTRTASNFFDAYPRFYETSKTANSTGRLNLRYEAIFAENQDVFADATVLDIASHDGRWSLAALATGARHVTGIEARPDLVDHAETSLREYGFGADRATFVRSDVFEAFAEKTYEVDVVLCLGFLYHTLRYNELFAGIARARPSTVIIDTQAQPLLTGPPAVWIGLESSALQMNAVADRFTRGERVLRGRPNLAAVSAMADAYGYAVERLSNWPAIIRDNPELGGAGDYARFGRTTIRLRRA